MSPKSIMPKYAHLMKRKIDFTEIPVRMRAMQALGVPYTDEEIETSAQDAKDQAAEFAAEFIAQNGDSPYTTMDGDVIDLSDRRAIALVAYLQRLGVDLFKEPVETAAAPTEEEGGH